MREERREKREERREKRDGRREKEEWITLRRAVMRCAVLCCGQYLCCSKPLTFHNGVMFFASRRCSLKSANVLETATRSKNMRTLLKVKGFEQLCKCV